MDQEWNHGRVNLCAALNIVEIEMICIASKHTVTTNELLCILYYCISHILISA